VPLSCIIENPVKFPIVASPEYASALKYMSGPNFTIPKGRVTPAKVFPPFASPVCKLVSL